MIDEERSGYKEMKIHGSIYNFFYFFCMSTFQLTELFVNEAIRQEKFYNWKNIKNKQKILKSKFIKSELKWAERCRIILCKA